MDLKTHNDKCFVKDDDYDRKAFDADFDHFSKVIVKSNPKTENKLQQYFQQDDTRTNDNDGNVSNIGNADILDEDDDEERPKNKPQQYAKKGKDDKSSFKMNICDVLVAVILIVLQKLYILWKKDEYFQNWKETK